MLVDVTTLIRLYHGGYTNNNVYGSKPTRPIISTGVVVVLPFLDNISLKCPT